MIKKHYKRGYLQQIDNSSGKKPGVYIYQGRKPGFSAAYIGSGRNIPGYSRKAEAYGMRLAKKGHKKVKFRD